MKYPELFKPFTIGRCQIKNRIVMSPMHLGGRMDSDGNFNESVIDYYVARAKGGVGMIIPGICRVNYMGATSTFTQLSMAQDWHIEPMRAMADRIHAAGAKLCI